MNKKIKNYISNHKITSLFLCICISLILLLIASPTSRNNLKKLTNNKFFHSLGIFTEENKSISFTSNNYNDGGSWKIKETANWNFEKKSANLVIDLETIEKNINQNITKDVVLIIDKSESMVGDRLNILKLSTKKIANDIIDDGGKVAIITFSSTSEINTDFTNQKEEINNIIDNINGSGNTSYYSAYNNLNTLMNTYQKENNKEVVALFITDGYPNQDSPNEQAIYQILKANYEFLTINAISYENGNKTFDKITKISDSNYNANMDNLTETLENGLLLNSNSNYEYFEVISYIDKDNFKLNSRENVTTTLGNISLEEENSYQKIIWSYPESNLKTGAKAKLIIDLSLLDELKNQEGYYSLIEKTEINYKLDSEQTITETTTPVLENKKYNVIYSSNAPNNCNTTTNLKEKYFPNYYVAKTTDKLTCQDYEFKGWEIVEDDVVTLTTDTFIMPSHDVNINAIWTKSSLEKTMEATIKPRMNLYDTIEYENSKTQNIVKKYSGNGSDEYENDVYYYDNGLNNSINNNVLFAGSCWKIIRTTETGGVKLIYNGIPSDDNSCSSNRIGVEEDKTLKSIEISDSLLYSKSFTYDELQEKYDLENIKLLTEDNILNFNETIQNQLIDSYICSENVNSTSCYKIGKIKTATVNNNVLNIEYYDLNKLSSYSVIGDSKYNDNSSLSSVGYMYNKNYEINSYNQTIENTDIYNVLTIEDEMPYTISENINCDNDNCTQENIIAIDTTNQNEIASILKEKYFIKNSIPCYIVDTYIEDSLIYILYLENANGTNLTTLNKNIVIGNSYSSNNDNTYTLNNTATYNLFNWSTISSSNLNNKFICPDFTSTCTNPQIIVSNNKYSYKYTIANKMLFGDSFTHNGTTYTLTETSTEYNTLNAAKKYTCFNESGTCATIHYMIDFENYYDLEDGKNINNIIEEMLFATDVNKNDSTIKQLIDLWYENNLLSYNSKLENTVFCNNRSLKNTTFATNPMLEFKSKYSNNPADLTCEKETDAFSTTNIKAKLKYPIGLITLDELKLISTSIVSNNYWTMTPQDLIKDVTINSRIATSTSSYNPNETIGVRPVISLKNNTFYTEGNGEENYPYVIE